MEEIREEVLRVMMKNRKIGRGYAYTCPSRFKYPHQWLWDSCFHAIINSHLDLDFAKAEMKTLLSTQRANGFIGNMTMWESPRFLGKLARWLFFEGR